MCVLACDKKTFASSERRVVELDQVLGELKIIEAIMESMDELGVAGVRPAGQASSSQP